MPETSELELIHSVLEQLGARPASAKGSSRAEVERLSRALAAIADAAAGRAHDRPDETADERTAVALAGIELVARGELMRGNASALREQLPGFVYLVVLPAAGIDPALELASRAKALLEETHG